MSVDTLNSRKAVTADSVFLYSTVEAETTVPLSADPELSKVLSFKAWSESELFAASHAVRYSAFVFTAFYSHLIIIMKLF